MRGLLVVVALLIASSASAQTYLKREPLVLRADTSVLVNSPACGSFRVMKVIGSIGALPRKRICIVPGEERASLGQIQ